MEIHWPFAHTNSSAEQGKICGLMTIDSDVAFLGVTLVGGLSLAQSSSSVPCLHSAMLLQRAILGMQSVRGGQRMELDGQVGFCPALEQ